jgi:hypothetical protein
MIDEVSQLYKTPGNIMLVYFNLNSFQKIREGKWLWTNCWHEIPVLFVLLNSLSISFHSVSATSQNFNSATFLYEAATAYIITLYFQPTFLKQTYAISMLSVNPNPPRSIINFRMPKPNFLKLGMYITTPQPISTAYLTNPLISLCVCMCSPLSLQRNASAKWIPPFGARQRHGKYVPPATNICTKNCWTCTFLCDPCLIKGESMGLPVYPPIVAR